MVDVLQALLLQEVGKVEAKVKTKASVLLDHQRLPMLTAKVVAEERASQKAKADQIVGLATAVQKGKANPPKAEVNERGYLLQHGRHRGVLTRTAAVRDSIHEIVHLPTSSRSRRRMARSAMVEENRQLERLKKGRCRKRMEKLSSCSMSEFMGSFMGKLSKQISWECAIKNLTGDLDLGVLGFGQARGCVVPRCSVSVPDCVAHLLSKGPKSVIGRRSIPKLRDLNIAMESFSRQLVCCKFFEGQKMECTAPATSLQWSGLMLPSTWQPPKGRCLDGLLQELQAEAKAYLAAASAKFKPFSNLDAVDCMGLAWLKTNKYIVVKDDKGSSLIPQLKTFKLGTSVRLASDHEQFELVEPPKLNVFLAIEELVPQLGLPRRVAGLLTSPKAFEEWPIHNIEYTWKLHKPMQCARCIAPTTRSPLTPLAKVVQRRLKPVVASRSSIVTCTRDVVIALDGMPILSMPGLEQVISKTSIPRLVLSKHVR